MRPSQLTVHGLRLGAFILIVIGVIVLVAVYLLASAPHTVTTGDNEATEIGNDQMMTGYTASVSWSGQLPTTEVYVTDSQTSCSSNPIGLVGNGSGPAGTIRVSLSSDRVYWLYACSGLSEVQLNATVSYSGGIQQGDLGVGLTFATGFVLLARSYFSSPGIHSEPPVGGSEPPVQ